MRPFALLGLLGVGLCSATIDFQQMRVRDLRAYLSARNAACIGCSEKHEFVTKAMELSKEGSQTKTNAKSESNPKSKISKPNRGNITLPSSQEIHGFIFLFVLCMIAIWQCCWAPARRMIYRWKKHKEIDAITLKRVRDPYKLGCCQQVCERRTLALWMQKSQLVRLRNDGILHVQRVAQCQLCRGIFEPPSVRSLLNEFDFNIPVRGDFAIESRVCDPAFVRGEVDRQYFYWIKTKEELDEERRNFAVAPSHSENINCADDLPIDDSSSTSPQEWRSFDLVPGATPFALASTESTSIALEENEYIFDTEQTLQLQHMSRSCSGICDQVVDVDDNTRFQRNRNPDTEDLVGECAGMGGVRPRIFFPGGRPIAKSLHDCSNADEKHLEELDQGDDKDEEVDDEEERRKTR